MKDIYQLTSNEKNLKKSWLYLTILRAVWRFLQAYSIPFFLPTGVVLDESKYMNHLIGTGIGSLVAVGILYVCAYKSPGVRLLKLILIASFIFLGIEIHDFMISMDISDPWSLVSIVTEMVLFVWWYWLTFKLAALNYRIKNTSNSCVGNSQ